MGVPESTIDFHSRASLRDAQPAYREILGDDTLHGLEQLPTGPFA